MKHEQIVSLCSKTAGIITIFIGCIVLSGWVFDITLLKSISPDWITMMPVTAICFFLTGVSLIIKQQPLAYSNSLKNTGVKHNRYTAIANGCAYAVIVLGALTIAEYIFNTNIGIDFMFFKEKLNYTQTAYPGRMAFLASVNFILIGLALLSLGLKSKFHIYVHEFLSFLIFFISMPVILGYLYNENLYYGVAKYYKPVAFNTAIAFIIFSLGLLCARPKTGIMAIVVHEGAGGALARTLFPAAILIPPIIAFIRLQGELAGLYSTAFGLALFALSNMVTFVVIVWITANRIHKIDMERKEAENTEYTHRKLLETLIEFAPDPFVFVKNDGRIALVNKQAEECFGFSRHELLGKYVEVLLPENLRETHVRHRTKYFTNPISRAMGSGLNLFAQRKNGETFPIELSLSPVHTQNGILVACIVRDITERKKTEEAITHQNMELQRSNTELERFAYVASHDLQEPLRMVAGYTQLLARRYKEKLDQDANEFINYAVDGATRMQKLINDLLAYSRLDTKSRSFELINSESILKDVISNLKVTIEEFNATISYSSLPIINADKTQILQLFQNLIANSIKFHGNDLPMIKITASEKDKEWLFSLSDNGIGIDPKYFDRIFLIFQRLHTKEEFPGTGIGLAICKKIVERHGGKIWVESTPGRGSTFYFTITKKGGQ